MNAANSDTTGNTFDMMAIFDTIEVRNEDKISATDREFCEQTQHNLYTTLDQIDSWYKPFVEEGERYKESHNPIYHKNGSVKSREPHRYCDDDRQDFSMHEFIPFETINKLADAYYNAVRGFGRRIVGYFNGIYKLSCTLPPMEQDDFIYGSRPKYITYVNMVIDHLGGRNFRETAEEELILRFQGSAKSSYGKVPELKKDKIIFHNIFTMDEFWMKYGDYKISWTDMKEVDNICAGLVFACEGKLSGGAGIILRFNSDKVDITEPYSVVTRSISEVKFFKNGRIDVKFDDAASASACYTKLRVEDLYKARRN